MALARLDALDKVEFDADLDAPQIPELVGIAEIADMLGVSKPWRLRCLAILAFLNQACG